MGLTDKERQLLEENYISGNFCVSLNHQLMDKLRKDDPKNSNETRDTSSLDKFKTEYINLKKTACLLSRLNCKKNGKIGSFTCPINYDCENCKGDKIIINTKRLSEALDIDYETFRQRIVRKAENDYVHLPSVACLSVLSGLSVLKLLSLPEPYLFDKTGKIINVDKKYNITGLSKAIIEITNNGNPTNARNFMHGLNYNLREVEINYDTAEELFNLFVF